MKNKVAIRRFRQGQTFNGNNNYYYNYVNMLFWPGRKNEIIRIMLISHSTVFWNYVNINNITLNVVWLGRRNEIISNNISAIKSAP
jgi:hypothetical protein